jgi:hypothetical protein
LAPWLAATDGDDHTKTADEDTSAAYALSSTLPDRTEAEVERGHIEHLANA